MKVLCNCNLRLCLLVNVCNEEQCLEWVKVILRMKNDRNNIRFVKKKYINLSSLFSQFWLIQEFIEFEFFL